MFTDDIIRRALEEDLGHGDLTTDAIIPEETVGIGRIIAKERLVLAGAGVAGGTFAILDPKLQIRQKVSDGTEVDAGAILLEVEGNYRSLLRGERVALNFVQRLSGIATLTREYVRRVGSGPTKILDTRKTVPLFRHLDKYAVRAGGGVNHRSGLFDAILIKRNHITACGGDLPEAVRRARKRHPDRPVTVEIVAPKEVDAAIEAGASRLLLDNMNDDLVEAAIAVVRHRVPVEVSGGVTPDRVEKLSRLGVEYVSVGALTHSPRAVDIHFRIDVR